MHAQSAVLCSLHSNPGPEEWHLARSAPSGDAAALLALCTRRASQFNVKRLQFVPTLFWVDTGEAACGGYGGQWVVGAVHKGAAHYSTLTCLAQPGCPPAFPAAGRPARPAPRL